MKQKCAIFMLVLMVVVVGTIAKKDIQQQKHDQEKIHKKPLMTHHWEGGSKSEHHAIKEVMKHAPHTVNHHEAKTQLDLGGGHGNLKKQVQSASSTAELKLQDLSLEDNVHHKIQNEKLHDKQHSVPLNGRSHKTAVHNKQHQHIALPLKSNNNKIGHGIHGNNFGVNGSEKKEKKAAKKILMNKNKKYKRTRRLHKFIW